MDLFFCFICYLSGLLPNFPFTYKGFTIPGLNEMFLAQISIDFVRNNNLILQGIIIFLVILIFGYSAKLLYEKRFDKE
jgi:TM2 domain-containing membrane protein YozV